jgi:hypothetical protein
MPILRNGVSYMKYLELLEKGNITPNFWCSEEYFEKALLYGVKNGDYISFLDDDWIVFPPINEETLKLETKEGRLEGKIWSDFPEWKPTNEWKPKFLDLEYIYNPKDFLHMDGGKWQVFRKNCRKWPRRFTGERHLHYEWVLETHKWKSLDKLNDELSAVLASWLESKSPEDKIMDDDVLLKYLFHGENRKALHHNDKIYGVNIWDENYKYINFRYSVCLPDEFLSEYMRWLFYTDPFIQGKNKLVNDGGILDNPNLKRFKDKMNPLQVREVYSWIKKEDIKDV